MEDYRNSKLEPQTTPHGHEAELVVRSSRWVSAALVMAFLLSLGIGYSLYQINKEFMASFQDLNDQVGELQDTLPLFAGRIDEQQQRLGSLSSDWEVIQSRIGVTEQELAESRILAEDLRQEQGRSLDKLSEQIVIKANLADLEDLKTDANGRFEQVDAKLSGVEGKVGRNIEEMERAWQELARVGVKVAENGNLIATNLDGIRELEGRGERDYFQFTATLYRPFRVGDITLELRDTNRGKNRAKLRLSFDDKRIVRGRIATNQPLTLYVGQDQVPYQVVINEVERGRIWGYVSVPVKSTNLGQIAGVTPKGLVSNSQ